MPVPPAAIAAAAAAAPAQAERGWISSRSFDTALVLGAPLTGLVTMLVTTSFAQGVLFMAALAYFVGIPHYLSTFVFFAGDDQREQYMARPLAFIGGPLLIFASVAALRLSGAFEVVLAAIFLWNIWHVAMQSAGVASLYRQLHGGAQSEKRVAHLSMLTTNGAMALWYADTFPPLAKFFGGAAIRAVAMTAAVIAAIAVVTLIVKIARREKPIALPEAAALFAGLTLFHPFLWVKSLDTATFGMLIGHFVQYLALVWLIQSRKYAPRRDGSIAQRAVASVSRRPLAIVAAFVITGLVVYGISKVFDVAGQRAIFLVVLNSLALVHFYLDGFIWAFRNPAVRKALGPWVTLPSHRVGA